MISAHVSVCNCVCVASGVGRGRRGVCVGDDEGSETALITECVV